MTTFICFVIAMAVLYIMQLLGGGFDLNELVSFLIMILIVGAHTYLCTRKKAIFGIIIPLFIAATFYPVYRIINPVGAESIVLIILYIASLGACLFVWYKARKE